MGGFFADARNDVRLVRRPDGAALLFRAAARPRRARYFIGYGAFANWFQKQQLCSVWNAASAMSSTFPPSPKLSTPWLEA